MFTVFGQDKHTVRINNNVQIGTLISDLIALTSYTLRYQTTNANPLIIDLLIAVGRCVHNESKVVLLMAYLINNYDLELSDFDRLHIDEELLNVIELSIEKGFDNDQIRKRIVSHHYVWEAKLNTLRMQQDINHKTKLSNGYNQDQASFVDKELEFYMQYYNHFNSEN